MSSAVDLGPDELISVVIPAFNAARHLERTLASVLCQTHSQLEVIIVDDGSTDATAEVADRVMRADPRVRLIRTSNQGVSAARNLAISQAAGRLIAPIDADDLWHPEKLARQLAVLRKSGPKVGVVYCWSAGIDENDGVILKSWVESRAEGNVLHDIVVAGILGNGSTPLIRREYIDAVGGYDTNMRLCEDWKFYTALAGVCEFAVVPQHLTGYRLRNDSASMDISALERAIEGVTEWIQSTWPELPPSVLKRRAYTINRYLAFLAIRRRHVLQALRYQARAYGIEPRKILSWWTVEFNALICGALLGIQRYTWKFWGPPTPFLPESILLRAPGVPGGPKQSDECV